MTDDNTSDFDGADFTTDLDGGDFDRADFGDTDLGTDDFADNGTAAADDLDDLRAEDYVAAAEIMAQEAAQAQETATDSDGAAELDARDQKYRQRLRSAEAENDRLHGLVESMQTAEIHRVATGRLADPGDLFRDGLAVADLCDDDGRVDQAKVASAIDEVLQTHPHWRAPIAAYRGPLHSGATSVPIDRQPRKFADSFAPRRE